MSPERFTAVRPSAQGGPEGKNGKEQEDILAGFSEAEREDILHKQKILSSLGYFIGKDFDMPILLNTPGAGWHWDFKKNHIKIDPKDLLEKPIEYLRFVISHEGGHRRISRTDAIPEEVWRQPGFSFMMNAIEDPRDNNFVADAYPKFREQMHVAYTLEAEFEQEAKKAAEAKLGTIPRFLQAGHEYIKQWFNEASGKPFALDTSLPEEVRAAVEKTLPAAQESWWRYPSKEEADESEELIQRYAEASYRITLEKIWPEFKKLVDEDVKDQETREALEDLRQSGELKEGEIDPNELSPELKKKLEAYVESLPQEAKEELERRAREAIREVEEEINKALEAKLAEGREEKKEEEPEGAPEQSPAPESYDPDRRSAEAVREKLDSLLAPSGDAYEQTMREALPLISRLEDDLREIFVERRARAWQPGHRYGKKLDLKRRIQEKAKGVSAFESRTWKKREAPSEKDYAISLLVDLSGSMRGQKIRETFKAVVVLAEVLNALSIKTEILGFNDRIHTFQDFGEQLSDEIRRKMSGMLAEVNSERARYNDDGWALKEASAGLAREEAQEKFLIALSDGRPEESGAHAGPEFELRRVVEEVIAHTEQKLIGLGIGSGTDHVSRYYPNSLADVPVAEMAEKLADLLREVIENYRAF